MLAARQCCVALTRHCLVWDLAGNNPIYNMLPDTLAGLSVDDSVGLETFAKVMKFLLNFIRKEKHTEALVDKLCHRFQATEGNGKQVC